nr:sensor histidine kinase [uncultured bacterium]
MTTLSAAVTTERPANVWQAMARGPLRFLRSGWPWRALAYLAFGALVGVLILALVKLLNTADSPVGYLVAGLVLLAFATALAMPLAAVERNRLRLVDTEPAGDPHVSVTGPGMGRWLRARLGEAATWRELSYSIAFITALPLVDFVIVTVVAVVLFLPMSPLLWFVFDMDVAVIIGSPVTDPFGRVAVGVLGLALLPVAGYLVSMVAAGQAAFARMLLAPKETDLTGKMWELTRSRTRLVDAFETERRRIERDLHDGAQQRLVTLIMRLGLAEHELAGVPGDGPRQVATARREAESALTEIRELVRGLHPHVLTDRGIQDAVVEIADRCPIPVRVCVTLPGRLPSGIEAVAYFVVSEALANVIKHSGARRAEVTGRMTGETLVLSITDDGMGGADATRGTGLQGLADRVSVVAGRLTLTSPAGGPTEVRVELPCPTADCG